ncbi:MAG: hypothetical protein HYV63_29165 [Candidatus Schekmanbacteria bacterium]|nr:hypothetical protein [Candidatus Schekmanbacteria bacterium]
MMANLLRTRALRIAHSLTSLLLAIRAWMLRGSQFRAKRVVVEHEQALPASADKVFPLLCPKREYDWIENWKCEILYSDSGYAEKDCVFVNLATYETWVLTRHEPENYLFEAAVFANHVVMKVELSLFDRPDGTSSVKARCTATAVTHVGNWFVGGSARNRLKTRLQKLFSQLEHYLITGEMLRAKRAKERRAR